MDATSPTSSSSAQQADAGRRLLDAALRFVSPYDEALQEEVFLSAGTGPLATAAVPVKNTFIHVDLPFSSQTLVDVEGKKWITAPAIVQEKSFHTKYPGMELAHVRGECKPCAYHVYKPDGCRQGDSCPFCHLCSRGEIKRRKKEKTRLLKSLDGGATDAAAPAPAVGSEPAEPVAAPSPSPVRVVGVARAGQARGYVVSAGAPQAVSTFRGLALPAA